MGGLALLAGENGVLTPPPSDAPALASASAAPLLAPSALAILAFLDFLEGASRLALARGGCHFYNFIFDFLCAEAGRGTKSEIIDNSCPSP